MHYRFLATGLLSTSALLAQLSSFPKPSYFRETFSKPETRVELQPPVRLQDYVVDGKLELSLRSYLELVLANNTDIQITRLSVETAKNAVTRAFAPFDPVATGFFQNQRSVTPASDALAGASSQAGAAAVRQLLQPYRFDYTQRMASGVNYTVTFSGQKNFSSSGFQLYNPALTSNLGFNFSQPLLRNRGAYVNRLNISIARSKLRSTEYTFRDNLLNLLQTAENAYWDVVLARENLAVAESSLNLADTLLKRAELELKLGAMSPLDIYQPQQQYATAEISVSQAKYLLQQRWDALRKQIGADLDPEIRKLPIVLTETVLPPANTGAIDAEAKVQKALAMRPDLKAGMENLDTDDLSIKSAANGLRPDLQLIGGYTSQGRGGTFYQRTNVFSDTGARNTVVNILPGGYTDALDQMFGFGFPIYSFGLRLTLPIKNRQAAADMADAVIQKRRDSLNVRNLEQTIRLDVLNAVSQVESSKASVELAAKARDFARKRLDAEQKKYELGTSQIFFVAQAQTDLVAAESALVQNSIGYRRSLLNLLRRTGELLEERGIVVP